MKKLMYLLAFIAILPLIFVSCEEPDDPKSDGEDTTGVASYTDEQIANITVNKWIYEEMDLYYLWTEYMPDYSIHANKPADFFSSLLYTKDRWSYLAEDYKTWINSLRGITESMGYSLALYWKDSDQKSIVGVVEFVYPNTPAAEAGLQRGNIIGKINGKEPDIDDYVDLFFNSTRSTINLGEYVKGALEYADTTITLLAREIEENPVLHYEILEQESKKIGYLVYVGYISNFNDDLNKALAYFKSENIDEMVLDLRYNPGGDLGAARELCSSIAPSSVIADESVLVRYLWNSELQSYWIDQNQSDQLRVLFDKSVPNNLNLSKVYVLTTGGTASASELTITGLDPYMEVVKIGETTHGKYAASITLPDKDSLWAIQPIVLKYANALRITDFEDGFEPDYAVDDNLDYVFGDLRDPMLNKAVELITGKPVVVAEKSATMTAPFGDRITTVGRNQRIQDGILSVENPFK